MMFNKLNKLPILMMIVPAITCAEPDLPTEIVRDKTMLQLKSDLEQRNFVAALEDITKLEKLKITLPPAIGYFKAKALYHTNHYDQANKEINDYFLKFGTNDSLYKEALDLAVQIEQTKRIPSGTSPAAKTLVQASPTTQDKRSEQIFQEKRKDGSLGLQMSTLTSRHEPEQFPTPVNTGGNASKNVAVTVAPPVHTPTVATVVRTPIVAATIQSATRSSNQTATVAVNPDAPTVTLTATPSLITYGTSTTFNWTSTNSTSCTSTGGGGTGTKGSFKVKGLTSSTSYSVTCTGPHGSATQSTKVTIGGPSASVAPLIATPFSIANVGRLAA